MEPAELLSRRPDLTLRSPIVAQPAPFGGLTIRTALLLGFGLTFGVWLFAGYYFAQRFGEVERRAGTINERMLKDSADIDLIRGVSSVAAGSSFFSPSVAKVMLDDYLRHLEEKDIVDRYDSLSEREREIFQLVAEGRSSKEVAGLLSVSPATVETHRAHILQKLDVHNTAELVLYAVRRGVIS